MARFQVLPQEEESISAVALSADGRRLAFVGVGANGQRRLWVRPVDSLAAQVLAGTEGAGLPFWSPDGRFIAFFAQGKLRKVPSGGGAPQVLCDAEAGNGGTWSPAGIILFAPASDRGLFQVSADGGTPTPVTTRREGENGHRFPQFLPDGRRFLYLAQAGQRARAGIYVGSLDSKETVLLLETDVSAQYAPPGYLLFVRSGALMAQTFDVTATRLSGEVTSIADDVSYDTGGGRSDFAVAQGLLAYGERDTNRRELVWLDRGGQKVADAGSPADYIHPWLSPDEKRAVVEVVDPDTGAHGVWMLDLVRGSRSRLVAGTRGESFPDLVRRWPPDPLQLRPQRPMESVCKGLHWHGRGRSASHVANLDQRHRLVARWPLRHLSDECPGHEIGRLGATGDPAGTTVSRRERRSSRAAGAAFTRRALGGLRFRRLGPGGGPRSGLSGSDRQVDGLRRGWKSTAVATRWQRALLPLDGPQTDGRGHPRHGFVVRHRCAEDAF